MNNHATCGETCMSRRRFIRTGGGATITLMLTGLPGIAGAVEAPAWISEYPEKRIIRLADLTPHVPYNFDYPDEGSPCFVVRMEGRAGGGVGPDQSIVAFHAVCPHMGGPMQNTYRREHAAAGPCPYHLSSFDLRKHGMVIAGHSTESLPQVVLGVDAGWIVATGMMGLIYGRASNLNGS